MGDLQFSDTNIRIISLNIRSMMQCSTKRIELSDIWSKPT